MLLDLETLTASGLGEGVGEPVHLEGHFRVPSQHVPESLVRESDLVSMFIDEAPHTDLHQNIPCREVYRSRYRKARLRSVKLHLRHVATMI